MTSTNPTSVEVPRALSPISPVFNGKSDEWIYNYLVMVRGWLHRDKSFWEATLRNVLLEIKDRGLLDGGRSQAS